MNYSGFCARYGEQNMKLVACLTPAFLSVALQATQETPYIVMLTSSVFASVAGLFGFMSGKVAHEFANDYLRQKDIGLSRGSSIVKKVQVAAYSAPVALMLGFNTMVVADQDFSEGIVDDPTETILFQDNLITFQNN